MTSVMRTNEERLRYAAGGAAGVPQGDAFMLGPKDRALIGAFAVMTAMGCTPESNVTALHAVALQVREGVSG